MKPGLNVAKFGGTSMGSAEAMQKAARLVLENPNTRFVVVSAISGATNVLLQAYLQSVSRAEGAVADSLGDLERRHEEIAKALGVSDSQKAAMAAIFTELHSILSLQLGSDHVLDRVLSVGERLSSILFTQALVRAGLDAQTIDARKLLRTDALFGRAEPQPEATRQNCEQYALPLLEQGKILVTQGFIGATKDGQTTTLGRGGSDYSAALFAEALRAETLHIWTDVNGIYTMDPRTVPEARIIPEITFGEAAELANFGAKVLHPATLVPAVRQNIKVFVGNTFSPEKGGTWIYGELNEKPLLRAIAVRDRQTLITVSSMRMLNTHGFLAKMFAILAQHQISVDLVTTSEVSVALTIDGTNAGSSGKSVLANEELLNELRQFADVKVEENLSLLALIGNRLSATPGIAARAFQSIGEHNVRLICQGASHNSMCFLVSSHEAKSVAQRLHKEFL